MNSNPPNAGNPKAWAHGRCGPGGCGKKKGEPGHACKGISRALYDRMVETYFATQDVLDVARQCAVHRRTAEKYIYRGDPKRAMPAIRDRYIAAQAKTQVLQDRSWAEEQAQWKNMFSDIRGLFQEVLTRLEADPVKKKKFILRMLDSPTVMIKIMSQLMRDEYFLYGGPDHRAEEGSAYAMARAWENMTATWNDRDHDEYAKTGKVPERFRAQAITMIPDDDGSTEPVERFNKLR
jgi:hypothetical protein